MQISTLKQFGYDIPYDNPRTYRWRMKKAFRKLHKQAKDSGYKQYLLQGPIIASCFDGAEFMRVDITVGEDLILYEEPSYVTKGKGYQYKICKVY